MYIHMCVHVYLVGQFVLRPDDGSAIPDLVHPVAGVQIPYHAHGISGYSIHACVEWVGGWVPGRRECMYMCAAAHLSTLLSNEQRSALSIPGSMSNLLSAR